MHTNINEDAFPVLQDWLFLSHKSPSNPAEHFSQSCHVFTAEDELTYIPFCDDFGPVNLHQVFRFYELIEEKRNIYAGKNLILVTEEGSRTKTNAVFLLGTYLILSHSMSADAVWDIFSPLALQLEMYRDATFSNDAFRLSLLDCWSGFVHAIELGWLDQMDLDGYAHYDNPLEGDLHCVVPGKLIAFKGPRALSDGCLYEDKDGLRVFSPRFYCDAAFADMGVTDVVRLNELEYDPADFAAAGIACADLEFDDCTVPPPRVVADFLFTVSRAAGAVAVHCKAGLGRTGTLIALYMMEQHGFTARAAMGWLRIVRPGSVIGDQQDFLCRVEADGRDIITAAAAASVLDRFVDAGRAARLAAQVADALGSAERTAGRAGQAGRRCKVL